MRQLLLFLFVSLALMPAAAQAQGAQEALVRFAKADRPGTVVTYPYPKNAVEDVIRTRFDAAGLGSPKSEKGFTAYKGVTWAEISPSTVEIYYKVEDSKGDKSTVMMIVSKGYDNYVSSATDAGMEAKIKTFLDGLGPDAVVILGKWAAAQALAAQQDAVRKAEKAYKDADEDGNRFSREREKLDRQIADNAAEKQKRGDALNAEKAKLDALAAQQPK